MRDRNGEMGFLPIALVGDKWREYDLPRRNARGEVIYPYWVEAIRCGEVRRVRAEAIYEWLSPEKQARMQSPIGVERFGVYTSCYWIRAVWLTTRSGHDSRIFHRCRTGICKCQLRSMKASE
jgi:hypothetical protein